MKHSVITHAKSLLGIPKVVWVVFQDDSTLGLYQRFTCGCCHINLDAIRLHQSFPKRLGVLAHETLHHIFRIFPEEIYSFLDMCLDMTDGNDPLAYYGVYEDTLVLSEF